ncbi:MAG: radical SAM protein [Alloprevotella sp.]|nr:radical SAM protein [Prevotella sp.]MBR1712112.1 radical SAM protein [Alloprevotella sp.]
MATVLYPSPVFGPVRSRRLGVSLGINLMPADGKVCTFDCIYCECGFNADRRPRVGRPSRGEVAAGLEAQLRRMAAEGVLPDVLTFAGNGEPTAHPEFAAIVEDVLGLRDRYCPAARVSVLSNGTRAHLPEVHEALLRVDCNILKLDTVDADYVERVCRPAGRYDVERVVDTLCGFGGRVIVQTMFMCGEYGGRSVDNTGAEFVGPWLAALRRIRPQQVMVYTIDRETPAAGLRKASPARLDGIAELVRAEGIPVSVSY